ncbi:unnamed protein product [Calicophoron daubneyi]|uniref:Trematode PH-like domain-containing protein n=1 Tax=Calicophoron daubneyi TaxID=300641 RepID=A0AAV2TML5_CALDB
MPALRGKRYRDQTNTIVGRASSAPNVNTSTLDVKTRQPILYETRVWVLGRNKLACGEQYSQAKAEVLIDRWYRTRHSYCKLFCLRDCISFRKVKVLCAQPIRNFVLYRSIRHVIVSPNKPDAFILCIDSGRFNNRYYEGFRCERREDVLTICELIRQANGEVDCHTRGLVPFREAEHHSHSSIDLRYRSETELYNRRRSPEPPVEDHQISFDRTVWGENPTQEPAENISVHEKTYQRRSPVVEKVVHEKLVRSNFATPLSRTNGNMVESDKQRTGKISTNGDDDWEVSVTYLQYDPLHGAVVNDVGPVYMYFARRLHTNQ